MAGQTVTAAMTTQVLICDADPVSRGALATALSRGSMLVAEIGDPGRVIDMVRRGWASVVVLDMDLPNRSAIRLVRLIRSEDQPRPPAIIVLCNPVADRALVAEFAQAGVDGMIVRPIDPEKAIRIIRQAIDRDRGHAGSSHTPLVAGDLGASTDPRKARVVESNSSLLVRPVECPCHETPPQFDRFTLRRGKVQTETNFFDLPVYTHAIQGGDYINFHRLTTLVCPECWFASAEPGYFAHPGQSRHELIKLPERVVHALAGGAEQRRAAAAGLGAEFFTENRSLEQAVFAAKLALNCSKTIHEADPDAFAVELVRMANYHLKLAHLLPLAAHPNAEPSAADPAAPSRTEIGHIRRAFELLEEAFTRVGEDVLPKTVYQLVATGIYLGEDKSVYAAMVFLREFAERPDLAETVAQQSGQYLARIRTAWEDRDYHRLSAPAA